jgi:hypothetical protein
MPGEPLYVWTDTTAQRTVNYVYDAANCLTNVAG